MRMETSKLRRADLSGLEHMLCPSCKNQGKEVVMEQVELLNHPEKVVMVCPDAHDHWEIVDLISNSRGT